MSVVHKMLSKSSAIGRRLRKMSTRAVKWHQIERFEEDWAVRIRLMADFIPAGSTVVDFGCGPMWLKRYVDASRYIPVDYADRGDGTIVCDLNVDPYPHVDADVAFVSGCLEYIDDAPAFIAYVAKDFQRCVISYCTVEHFSDRAARRELAWRNDFSHAEIIDLFAATGFALVETAITPSNNSIFVFDRADGN